MLELNKDYIMDDSYIVGNSYKVFKIKTSRNGKITSVRLLRAQYLDEPIIKELEDRGFERDMLDAYHDYDCGRVYDVYVYNGKLIYVHYTNGKIRFCDLSEKLNGYGLYYDGEKLDFDINSGRMSELISCCGNGGYWFNNTHNRFVLPIVNVLRLVTPMSVSRYNHICAQYTMDDLYEIWRKGYLITNDSGSFTRLLDKDQDIEAFNEILQYVFEDDKLIIKEFNIDIGGINL